MHRKDIEKDKKRLAFIFFRRKTLQNVVPNPREQQAQWGSGKVRVWLSEVLKYLKVLLLLSKGKLKDDIYTSAPRFP